jgi:3-phenylpropionate/trans-cinnamate dioxygenase ferredoxin reductase subunit
MRRIVIVGASLGGLRAGEALRRSGFGGELVLVGDEPYQPYDRPPLSKALLSGDWNPSWLRQVKTLAPTWRLGVGATRLSPTTCTVHLGDGAALEYDGLVIATGLRARELPGARSDGRRIHLLRSLRDAFRLRETLSAADSLVIVGGGFIGTEVASTARAHGLAVTMISSTPLLERGLGPLATTASDRARRAGVTVLDDQQVAGVIPTDFSVAVELVGTQRVEADVLVVAVGAVPNVEWLGDSGLELDDGLWCDASLAAVGYSNIVGVGDVVNWPHPAAGGARVRLEHWTNAVEQAQSAARRLLTGESLPFAPVPSFWTDQFGIRLQGVGLTALADSVEVVGGDPLSDTFSAEYRLRGRLVGAVAAGSAAALLPYRRELADSMKVSLVG